MGYHSDCNEVYLKIPSIKMFLIKNSHYQSVSYWKFLWKGTYVWNEKFFFVQIENCRDESSNQGLNPISQLIAAEKKVCKSWVELCNTEIEW